VSPTSGNEIERVVWIPHEVLWSAAIFRRFDIGASFAGSGSKTLGFAKNAWQSWALSRHA
jgi:hypothetical protein